MTRSGPWLWLAGGGCAALAAALLLAAAALFWSWGRVPSPPALPLLPAGDTVAAAVTDAEALQRIAATAGEWPQLTAAQRRECADLFAQAAAADAAGKLAPAEHTQLIDAWATLLADNAVSDAELAAFRRTVAESVRE